MGTADDTAPHLSPGLALRLRMLDMLLRQLGYANEDSKPLWELKPVIAAIVAARAEDYGAGREGRSLSQQMTVVKPNEEKVK